MALLLIALIWGILAWKNPRQAVLWFPIFLPLYLLRTSFGPLPTTLLELSFWTMACGATLTLGLKPWRDGSTRLKPWHVPAALWLIATLIAIAVAPDHIAALGLWRAYVLEPLLFFVLLAGTLQNDQDRATVLRALLGSLGFVTLVAIVQFVSGQFIPHPWNTDILTRRATGPFPYPNALSLFAAPLAALFFGLAIFKQKKMDRCASRVDRFRARPARCPPRKKRRRFRGAHGRGLRDAPCDQKDAMADRRRNRRRDPPRPCDSDNPHKKSSRRFRSTNGPAKSARSSGTKVGTC